MTLNEIIKQSHDNAVKRKKYDCPFCGVGKHAKHNVIEDMYDELSEFEDAVPSDTFHKDSEQSELVDMILILLAYSHEAGYDIEKAIIEKLEYNKTRVV